ncbi:MAG: hypothetical protein HOW73_07450 [Polyangiaceae bacterium]|nr:hypothetical protein [Polyangiaceae bacterium]
MVGRTFFLPLFASGCVAVLDLDAEADRQGGDASDGGGGSIAIGNGGASSTGGVDGTGGEPPLTGGNAACDDSSMIFAGGQFLSVTNQENDGLDVDDKITIGAWVRPSGAVPVPGDQFVLSRLNTVSSDGYALVVRTLDTGELHPEFRFYAGGVLCGCTANMAIPADAWTHIAARFFLNHLDGKDAGVWVGGEQACSIECGGAKLSKGLGPTIVGAAFDTTSGFFYGRLDDVYAMVADTNETPPMLDGASCFPGVKMLMPFDEAPSEGSAPDCNGDHLFIHLGKDMFVGADEPDWEACP